MTVVRRRIVSVRRNLEAEAHRTVSSSDSPVDRLRIRVEKGSKGAIRYRSVSSLRQRCRCVGQIVHVSLDSCVGESSMV